MPTVFSVEHLNATPWPKRWLWLGVTALAIAGIFAVVLVSARTPQLAAFQNLFSVSLVVHVDLSVLVWFLAIMGLLTAYNENAGGKRWPFFQAGAWLTTMFATALIAFSPLHPQWDVIKSNYIPVLYNAPFLFGLALLMTGMTVAVLPGLCKPPMRSNDTAGLISRAITWAAGTIAIAIAAFIATGQNMPGDLPRDHRFETLFWAGGHVLQFGYTQLAMIGWLVLLAALGADPSEKARGRLEWVFFLSLFFAFMVMPAFVLYDVMSGEFREYLTKSMIHAGGVAPLLMGGYALYRLRRIKPLKENRALYASLVMSLLLFAAGGIIGYLIRGQNVTIPAHYHGAIVAVTLSLMGMVYVMLPAFGYASVASWRLATWQPILYGVGQLLHVIGLAVSGGYGVLRKTPTGEMPNLTPAIKTALGFMGLGGMLAIIGGLLFVVVVVRSARAKLAEK